MIKRTTNFVRRNLAAAIVAGPWTTHEIVARLGRATGGLGRWRRRLALRVEQQFGADGPGQDVTAVERFLADIWNELEKVPPHVHELFFVRPIMRPTKIWDVPAIETAQELADFLEVEHQQLLWLADSQARNHRQPDPRLRHYITRFKTKRSGKRRLLEIPKKNLMQIQRRILDKILNRIPSHDAAHAFRANRSIRTFVEPHVGKYMVIRFDLRDYFLSIPAARVRAVFMSAGYPQTVARLLTGLCTTITPLDARKICDTFSWGNVRHLPQGAPTSPALANLCSYRLDKRLAAFAAKLNCNYTRYADDMAFSGGENLAHSARQVQVYIGMIALDEGFQLNYRKSRFMRSSTRQQLAGVVVNDKVNVKRLDYDNLKAILTNCIRHGPTTQNRDGHAAFRDHLRGRIAHVSSIHPRRGEKLMRLFQSIHWNEL